MALIRAVLLLLFSMFLAFRKAVLLLLFDIFLALKRAVWYTAGYQCVCWSLTFHATRFQLYMWRHRCAGGQKKLYLHVRSGSQSHRYFVGFFNVPVQHRHGATLFVRLFWCKVVFYDTLGIRRPYSHLIPPASPRGQVISDWSLELFASCLSQRSINLFSS